MGPVTCFWVCGSVSINDIMFDHSFMRQLLKADWLVCFKGSSNHLPSFLRLMGPLSLPNLFSGISSRTQWETVEGSEEGTTSLYTPRADDSHTQPHVHIACGCVVCLLAAHGVREKLLQQGAILLLPSPCWCWWEHPGLWITLWQPFPHCRYS